MAPFAPCAFVGLGLKVEDGLAGRFQRAPHVPRGRVGGSPSGGGLGIDAPASLAQGRASLQESRQGGSGKNMVQVAAVLHYAAARPDCGLLHVFLATFGRLVGEMRLEGRRR